jgi:uncharacterized protein (DUF427 family)
MKAIWNDEVIAESQQTEVVEGNHYFPMEDVNKDYLQRSDSSSICPWKGTASYYHLKVNGKTNEDAAWYYAQPKEAARQIKDHIAFWKGVEIVE